MADAFHNFPFDQFLPAQPQTPALGLLWLLATEQGDQVRFGLPIEFAFLGTRGLRATEQGGVESLLAKAFAHAPHRAPTDHKGLADLADGPAWTFWATVSMQHNLGMPDLVGWGDSLFRQARQGFMLRCA
jgi:hypothetical protein